jgi:hypothetical protein
VRQIERTFIVFAAHRDDAHQGWIWLDEPALPVRSIVKITNPASGRHVYCEALQIEANFLRRYNRTGEGRQRIVNSASALVVGKWFRFKLGDLATRSQVSLRVSLANTSVGRFRACVDHPQVIVRIAAWLGFIGVALGLLSLAIACWPAISWLIDWASHCRASHPG